MKTKHPSVHINLLASAVLSAFICSPLAINADHGRFEKENNQTGYVQTNLVSDLAGTALLQDTNLVNAWGISFTPTSPFWVSDNGTGQSTLYAVTYDAMGHVNVAKQPLFVTIPGEGTPTGQTFNPFNSAGEFNGDIFLFVSEDGTISGWRPALGTSPGTSAEVLATRDGAVYKGVTLVQTSGGPRLLAANFSEGTIDAYDSDMNLVQYKDSRAPDGFAPFNVQSINGVVFVTFAFKEEGGDDDVPGTGHGLIDLFNPETGHFHRLVTGSAAGGRLREINSPWGVALAPKSFGEHGGDLLVGNFGNGTIMTFSMKNGQFQGLLKNTHNRPIVIDGLWGLTFGNGGNAGRPGTLYFTAGPEDESHGLFGSLDPAKRERDRDRDHDRDRD
jgi:uncharacterized protein (TIGR03118 family)